MVQYLLEEIFILTIQYFLLKDITIQFNMEVTIGNYLLTKRSFTPTHQIYDGHHTDHPHEKCSVQSIYSKWVPPIYKHLFPQGKSFREPFLLLKQVFIHPNDKKMYVFVQANRMDLRPLSSIIEQEKKVSFEKVFPWILLVARLFPIVANNNLIHDFDSANIVSDSQGNIYLKGFIKRLTNNHQFFTIAEIEQKIKVLFSQLMNKCQIKEITGLHFAIKSADSCSLKIVLDDKDDDIKIREVFCFQFTAEISQASIGFFLNDRLQNFEKRQISYEELKSGTKILSLLRKWMFHKGASDPENDDFIQPHTNESKNNQNPVKYQDKDSNIIKPPFNLIGVVRTVMKQANSADPAKKFEGMGVLISSNLVLTCAHNFHTKVQQIYKYKLLENNPKYITFHLKGKQYKVKSYKKHDNYLPGDDQRLKFDYALLELTEEVNDDEFKPYIRIVKDYQRVQKQITIYKEDKIKSSKVTFQKGKDFNFTQRIIFECNNDNDKQPRKGFSGAPITIIGAETQGLSRYYFIVGIYYGKQQKGQKFMANIFNKQNIQQLAKWEEEMTGKVKVFENIFSYTAILSMDKQLISLKRQIDDIKFTKEQEEQFSKMYRNLNFDKVMSEDRVQSMYFGRKDVNNLITFEGVIDKSKYSGQQLQRILLKMGSFNKLQRYNNIAFMHSIRNYEEWHREWYWFNGSREGMLLAPIYIIKRLLLFFELAHPTQAARIQYKQMLDVFNRQVYIIYMDKRIRGPSLKVICIKLLETVPAMLKLCPLNPRFKQILTILTDFAFIITQKFDESIKVFYLPKILVYTFIARQILHKMVKLDKDLKHYTQPFDTILEKILQVLKRKARTGFEEVIHTFMWNARDILNESGVALFAQIIDPEFQYHRKQKQQPQDRRKVRDEVCQEYIFGQQIWKQSEELYFMQAEDRAKLAQFAVELFRDALNLQANNVQQIIL